MTGSANMSMERVTRGSSQRCFPQVFRAPPQAKGKGAGASGVGEARYGKVARKTLLTRVLRQI